MASAVYSTDLSTIFADFVSAGDWDAYGGAGAIAVETDFYNQGNNCISKVAWSSTEKGMIYSAGSPVTVTASSGIFMWVTHLTPNSLNIEEPTSTGEGGGIQVALGNTASDLHRYDIRGSDSIRNGAPWICAVVDPTFDGDTSVGTPPSPGTSTSNLGAMANLPAGGPSKGNPFAIDACRHGRDFKITGGDATNPGTFISAAVYNDTSANRFGMFQQIDGGYLMQGRFLMGEAGTSCYFDDANRTILIARNRHVPADFTGFEVNNASTTVNWKNITVVAENSTQRGYFQANADASISVDSCTFVDMGFFLLGGATSQFTDCTFRRCDKISLNGGKLTGGQVVETNDVSAAVSCNDLALISAVDFVGTNSEHAVILGSVGGGSMNWNATFDSATYAAADGSAGNEVIHVDKASGTLTINVVAGADTPSIRTEGADVSVVAGAVTFTLNSVTKAGVAITSCQSLVYASNGTGDLPYQDSVTITQTGGEAAVAHTGHGLVTGNLVLIQGATNSEEEYNGVHTISVTDGNNYKFPVSAATSSPATGTITSTGVVLYGETTTDGALADTRSWSLDQPITGWSRSKSTSPYYKQGSVTGTIDKDSGLTTNAVLIVDE